MKVMQAALVALVVIVMVAIVDARVQDRAQLQANNLITMCNQQQSELRTIVDSLCVWYGGECAKMTRLEVSDD